MVEHNSCMTFPPHIEDHGTTETDLQYESKTNICRMLDEDTLHAESSCFSRENTIHTFTTADALENCGNWVKLSQELHQKRLEEEKKKNVSSSRKRKRNKTSNVEQQEGDSADEDDPDGDLVSVASSSHLVTRLKKVCARREIMNLQCEWLGCEYFSDNLDIFIRHVSMHIPDLEIRTNEDGNEVYVCLWDLCDFDTDDGKEIVRHVNYHSYHTKVKCIGSNMMNRTKFPGCTYNPDGKNFLPDLPDEFACCWLDCERRFNNSQMFFYHVQAHVQCNPRGKNVKGGVPCNWLGCKNVFRSIYKLGDHVRTHTQEKMVACPTCGCLFASKTKFFDHCKRQVPMELHDYQCSHCSKYYPSERLLRDHMRHHVNHYKCTFCDMTCPTPSSLSVHIRYRHLDSRPYKCSYCDHMSKTQHDMKHHLKVHIAEPIYRCSTEDCNYSCRSLYSINRHFRSEHEGLFDPLYCCHICDKRFQRGTTLTTHLFRCHSFRWPSGHCRFRYKHDEDGYYRLQTIRYESLEVTQEMLRAEIGEPEERPKIRNGRYNLRRRSKSQDHEVMFELEREVDREEKSGVGSNILITIEELDHKGNIIRSQRMETAEVPNLPDGGVPVIRDDVDVGVQIDYA